MSSQPANANRQILLAERPSGEPRESSFRLAEGPVPDPGEDEVLVRSLFLSVDPYMRGRMRDVKSYAPPIQLDEVMVGGVVGEVVRSNQSGLETGDIVLGMLGWQDYAVAKPGQLHKLDPRIQPISLALGVLGMPGLTAYFGLLDIGQPKDGETVVVSAASGAVGAVVGQIAKIKGCRVVGTAGSDAKVEYIMNELGFDAGINYKTAGNLGAALDAACPAGIDVYFDNVGGPLTDAVIARINERARLIICGQISQYNAEKPEMGPRNLFHFIRARARMEGFLIFDHAARYAEGQAALGQWIVDGKIKYREDVMDGLENAPKAFIRMLRGENFGKQLVHVADPSA
ncbi:MAG: NADP-dependent oxidoreductase [Proteobacteria bacterium]|nr:NADP-dependent oxidoreductase [Pseudomonadota bacterium]